eukprot:NODE_161_length_16629_cov_0.427344.p13 type:complete len:101 gc:universal NODE_161_length_16629_cov_0.427344:5077-5379(+)
MNQQIVLAKQISPHATIEKEYEARITLCPSTLDYSCINWNTHTLYKAELSVLYDICVILGTQFIYDIILCITVEDSDNSIWILPYRTRYSSTSVLDSAKQ